MPSYGRAYKQARLSVLTVPPPCRLCPHVVIVLGLERLSDLWGYAGRATHAWRAQSERPDQQGHGGLRRGSHQTWLRKRTSDGVTPKEDPLLKKRPELGQHNGRGRGNHSNEIIIVYLAPEVTEGAGGVFSH